MKKLALTIAIVLGLSMTTFADPNGGGLFNRGSDAQHIGNRDEKPLLPYHNMETNQNANTPLGSGIVVLTALGAAYLVGKRKREE